MKRQLGLLAAVLTLAALFSGPSAVGEEEEGGAHAESLCTMDNKVSIAIVPEIGLSFEAEIGPAEEGAQAPAGATKWFIRMAYNDLVIISTAVMSDPDGGMEIHKVMGNMPGADHLEMEAKNRNTGETCWGTLQADL